MRISLPWLALLLVLVFAAGRAQTLGALDPIKVAPHVYEVAFENERVRVLKQTIRPGEWPPIHEHPDSVTVYLNPCAWMVDEAGGERRMESFKFGTPVWTPAASHGGATATVVQECRVIVVELKD